jgi:protein-disulfide isomerase
MGAITPYCTVFGNFFVLLINEVRIRDKVCYNIRRMAIITKHLWKIITIAVVVLIGASVWYAGAAAERANEGITINDNVKGNPDATVSLVKYSDFQCPACAAAAGVVDDMLTQYGDQVRVEYRHFPLVTIHPHAVAAGAAAEAAGQQGKFWEMHNLLFTNQSVWGNSANPSVYFLQYGEEIGLDMTQFRRQMNASVLTDHVRDGFREARELGFSGTPTFTLNGERMEFSTYQEFIEQIATAVNGGTPEAAVPSSTGADVQFGL